MNFLTEILTKKQTELQDLEPVVPIANPISRPSLVNLLSQHPKHVQLIGEIKRASPSKGSINEQVDIKTQVARYEEANVCAISVLTDPYFFHGSIQDLNTVASLTTLPLLCKDFILDERQIIRAKQAGASIILLIVACLSSKRLAELFAFANTLGLEVLVETHDEAEIKQAQALQAPLIGVNNRNLETFEVSVEVSERCAPLKQNHFYISESGFKTAEDVKRVAHAYDAILVGETLMRSLDIKKTAHALQVIRT